MNKPTTTLLPIVYSEHSTFLFTLLRTCYHTNEEIIHDDSFGADMEILCFIVSDDTGRKVRIGFHSDTLWTAGFFRKAAGEEAFLFTHTSCNVSVPELLLLIPLFFLD